VQVQASMAAVPEEVTAPETVAAEARMTRRRASLAQTPARGRLLAAAEDAPKTAASTRGARRSSVCTVLASAPQVRFCLPAATRLLVWRALCSDRATPQRIRNHCLNSCTLGRFGLSKSMHMEACETAPRHGCRSRSHCALGAPSARCCCRWRHRWGRRWDRWA
jgi:hypothetical protein